MTQSPWRVPIATLRRAGTREREEIRTGQVPELKVAASTVPGGTEVTADLRLEAVEGGIEAVGTVTAPWAGECRRCLSPVSGTLECDVREFFRPGGTGHEVSSDEDDLDDAYPMEAEYVDLAPLITDALLLALPMAPLCREDCKGLCPTCGAQLNEGDCGCAAKVVDPRWAALNALKPDDG